MFLKTFFKFFIYASILIVLGSLIDFKNFSLKIIVPEKVEKTVTSKQAKAGLIKNSEVADIKAKNDFEGDNQDIVDLINEARRAEGLGEIIENKALDLSAMKKAIHMKENNYFDHVSPQGVQPWYFAQKQNYNYKNFGENLAEGYFSAKSVHEGWMNSTGHRENILSEKFKEVGVAILKFQQEGQKSYLIVQHFGTQLTPRDLVVEIVCEEESKEDCEDAEAKADKIEGLIEAQEKIIETAKEEGIGSEDLSRLEENLDDLEDAKGELGDYVKECDVFIKKCDVWK